MTTNPYANVTPDTLKMDRINIFKGNDKILTILEIIHDINLNGRNHFTIGVGISYEAKSKTHCMFTEEELRDHVFQNLRERGFSISSVYKGDYGRLSMDVEWNRISYLLLKPIKTIIQ